MMLLLSLKIGFDHPQERVFAFFEALNECLFGVSWEMLALNHEIMQIVSEVLGAYVTSVAVEDTKEAHLRPFTLPCLVLGLQYVQNNTHTVFIILSDNALVGVSCIGFDYAAFLVRGLGYFMVFELEGTRVQWNGVITE
jgi:hypothetical protein